MTEAEKQRWTEENREAFKAYDELVDKYGLFGDGKRLF
ncbi:type II toxin-antitoxin system CcdA family antitoxin [Azospirillum sp. A1-3]|nr:type II toxin-antitoxin system CcdA family antitoxin [Azospirillum sp. A1-3]